MAEAKKPGKSLKFSDGINFSVGNAPLGWGRFAGTVAKFVAPFIFQHVNDRTRATRHSYGPGNRGHIECRHLDEQFVMRQWVYMIQYFRGDETR